MWAPLRCRRAKLLFVLLCVTMTFGYLLVWNDEVSQAAPRHMKELLPHPPPPPPPPQPFQSQAAVQRMDMDVEEDDDDDLGTSNPVSTDSTRPSSPRYEEYEEDSTDTQDTDPGHVHATSTEIHYDDEHGTKMRSKNSGKEPAVVEKNRVHLLILAYMRTGSSMTGRILQYSPDVFYWYEPLHELERYYVTGGDITSKYRNLTLNEWFKASAMAGGNISATLSCDMAHVYPETLRHYFMKFGTFGTRPVHPCFVKANGTSTRQWDQCVINATRSCRQNFRATAVKTIRLHMARALEVMRRDPKVKVVHLLRDPRGVLLSRHKLGYANFERLDEEAELLCRKYRDDLDMVPPAGDPLRARYSLVRYEDIAVVPLEYTRSLYYLMEMEPTREVLKAVKTMTTFAKKVKDCPTCPPLPQDSSAVSQSWRQTLSLQEARTISRHCAPVLKRLGYRVDFEDEAELRNMNVSVVESLPSPFRQ
ncbi:carbohydrate sulfotransferase 1-like [Babylonia areolata]|uniref:carbohydrate sulfotransferase 1-like n=1 Tax=Babylonia areolata TaxID=304850 RepID=UPI003FCF045E